jgi:hypothetical protein
LSFSTDPFFSLPEKACDVGGGIRGPIIDHKEFPIGVRFAPTQP